MGKQKSKKDDEVVNHELETILNDNTSEGNLLPANTDKKEALPLTQDEIFITEKLILKGDLSGLSEAERVIYYGKFCQRLGLDPFTQPFKLIDMKGKLILYCDRSGAQQLNKKHKVSHEIMSRETKEMDGELFYIVTARASSPDGRFTDNLGVVPLTGQRGEYKSNAMMKAETKAKRRSTLDLLGLGLLDELEVEHELELQGEVGKIRERLAEIDTEKKKEREDKESKKNPDKHKTINYEVGLKMCKNLIELRSNYRQIPNDFITEKITNTAKELAEELKSRLNNPISEQTTTFDLLDLLQNIESKTELNNFLKLNMKTLDEQFGANDEVKKAFDNLKARIK